MFSQRNKHICPWRTHLSLACLGLLAAVSFLQAEPASIVIVKSAPRTELEKAAHEQTIGAIVSTLQNGGFELKVEVVDNVNGRGREKVFWQAINEENPKLVITVGTPATRSAVANLKNIPVVFTMVLNNIEHWKSNSSPSDISGVSLAIPLKTQLEMMVEALPGIRRVGLIYPAKSAAAYASLENIVHRMGLRLETAEIASERDIPTALRRILPEVDVFWLPPETLTYERNNRRFILLECFQSGVPIMAVTKQNAIAGTPLSLDIDYEDIGKQTAELALKRLKRGRPFSRPVSEHPRKVLLYINERVAASLGLDIPSNVVEQAISIKSGSR